MPGQNTLILATDYNTIQSRIAEVMGEGSGSKGYGQNILSSQVGQYSKITAAQWNNLRLDILRARQHQTGQDLTGSLAIASASRSISDADRAAMSTMSTDASLIGNYLISPPPTGEFARSNLVGEQVRTQKWNGTISQTVDITWDTANEARYFFNSGGTIEFSSTFTPSGPGLKGTSWSTLLLNMGTFSFDHTKTITTGSAFTVSNGFYDLSTTNTLICQKDTTTSAYTPNKYYILAKVNSTAPDQRRILTFTIYWEDSSTAPPSLPDPGFGIDEDVDGTLTSLVQVVRSDNNVVRPVPTAQTTGIG